MRRRSWRGSVFNLPRDRPVGWVRAAKRARRLAARDDRSLHGGLDDLNGDAAVGVAVRAVHAGDNDGARDELPAGDDRAEDNEAVDSALEDRAALFVRLSEE